MKKTLWSKNFTIITLGTVISAIGDTAMGFALSFVVFDTTGSTLLSALFTAVSSLPRILLPILVSPYLDNFRRKPVIVGLDYFSCAIYLLFGLYLLHNPFHLPLYLFFSLLGGCIGSVYGLAYQSLSPNLIPEGFAQKGYTVSGMLYPTVLMVMTPVASILYTQFGLAPICLVESLLLAVAATMETQIRLEERTKKGSRFSFRDYMQDFKDGFAYLKKEKGLLRIYSYMPVTQGLAEATDTLIRAWFRTAQDSTSPCTPCSLPPSSSGGPSAGWYITNLKSRRKNVFPLLMPSTSPTASWTPSSYGRDSRSCWPTGRYAASSASTAPRCVKAACKTIYRTTCGRRSTPSSRRSSPSFPRCSP